MEKLRLQADVLAAGGAGYEEYARATSNLAPRLAPIFDGQSGRLGAYANDVERLQDLDRQLQLECDQQAHRALVMATRRSAIAVAASPFLALDVFVVIAGNLNLVARIAGAYGLPSSPFLAARLLVQVYRQIAALGAIELGTELASETLSHALLARLSGRVAQGFSAGLYTYRIGVTAMALCRPLAFSESTKPRPGSLFKDLFKQLDADDALS
nr:YcjF family protein [Simiduia aestuariiviva]